MATVSRTCKATIEGRTHEIPEICIAGWIGAHRSRGESVDALDAIRWWDFNRQLSAIEAISDALATFA